MWWSGAGSNRRPPLFRCDRCPGQRRCRSVDSRRGASAVGVGCRRRCRRMTRPIGHGPGTIPTLAHHRSPGAIGCLSRLGVCCWYRAHPNGGLARPVSRSSRLRGPATRHRFPARPSSPGGAADRRAVICNRRTVRWVVSPDPGLVDEREACNPCPRPRGYTQPVARPPAAEPDEPGNQGWDRESQRCGSCQDYGDLTAARICAPPLDPEAEASAQVYGLVVM